ncbi:hypothetical protein [Arcobacter arenosus]|uniref:Uroporphyrinogen III synthase HEM4 n=1 Tax=Arcobacter arenosus TaxID=2576037 RepID=A0A5R8Y5C6_9BACT|nr:hypothetical protein [Arcobacter arenosus]TLP40990.1 hypothetical protein FDK22_02945 [Arcobacter arenosus]
MGLKKYIGFSLLLIIAVGLYVYSIENGDYRLSFLDFSLLLPTVIWILVPLVVLFIFSVLHLLFYGSINYCKNRSYIKDEEAIIDVLKSMLLQKNEKKRLKTPGFKNLSSILKQFKLEVGDSTFTSTNEGLNLVVSQIKDIKAGKYVNEKTLKLDPNSELAKQNLINKMNEQPDFSLDILKKSTNYSTDIVNVAFDNVVENKTMTTIKKVYNNIKLDREKAYKLFLKDIENIEFGLTKEEILKITKSLNYTQEEYVNLARLYKEVLSPDKLLELFETLSNENDEATTAYFYVLCELEMIEKLRDLLSGYEDNEMVPFRAILDLKEAGKHYSLDDIII